MYKILSSLFQIQKGDKNMVKRSWTTEETKKVNTEMEIEKVITNTVTKQSSNRAHVNVPFAWLNKKVKIEVLE